MYQSRKRKISYGEKKKNNNENINMSGLDK